MAYMTYKQLAAEQALPLDDKITRATDVIREAFAVSKHTQAIAFSGGKDSTVLWDIIRRYFPEEAERVHVIFGNTGVEYPESLKFARELGQKWGGERFHEVKPLLTTKEDLKYEAQAEVLRWIEEQGRLSEILKPDGKLKRTDILYDLCPPEMLADFRKRNLVWSEGSPKSYFWCVDQYGWPILGKAVSRLEAHRINIDCFLTHSQSRSDDPKLAEYYDILRDVKISHACCHFLKKEPSEVKQAELDVDVIFKGLMAAESRTRATSFLTRGPLFRAHRKHLPESDPFWHCSPLSLWTDDDIWDYIRRFKVPYSPLYDMFWEEKRYKVIPDPESPFGFREEPDNIKHYIPRNGCMACGTDFLFKNNHLATLRRTHPQAWEVFMKRGLADEIMNLQKCKRNGQYCIFDHFRGGSEYLLEHHPCAFDDLEGVVVGAMFADEGLTEYDPDAETTPLSPEEA